jgi:hypothetical protein
MTDTIHSCSYYCQIPACIKAQRDELREKLYQRTWVGLTNDDWISIYIHADKSVSRAAELAEKILKEKNT